MTLVNNDPGPSTSASAAATAAIACGQAGGSRGTSSTGSTRPPSSRRQPDRAPSRESPDCSFGPRADRRHDVDRLRRQRQHASAAAEQRRGGVERRHRIAELRRERGQDEIAHGVAGERPLPPKRCWKAPRPQRRLALPARPARPAPSADPRGQRAELRRAAGRRSRRRRRPSRSPSAAPSPGAARRGSPRARGRPRTRRPPADASRLTSLIRVPDRGARRGLRRPAPPADRPAPSRLPRCDGARRCSPTARVRKRLPSCSYPARTIASSSSLGRGSPRRPAG